MALPSSSLRWIGCATLLLGCSGCALFGGDSSTSTYATPPTAARVASSPGDTLGRPVAVIGRLDAPRTSVPLQGDIGRGITNALARQLGENSDLDVWRNPAIADDVDTALARRGGERTKALQAVKAAHPDVDYVITGRITDFLHTGELSEALRRTSGLGRHNEALVAIDITVVELESGRIVMSDHVHGSVRVGDDPVAEVYKDVSIESYLFWSTPLGRATTAAIDRVIDHVRRLLPVHLEQIRITRQLGPRRITVYGGGLQTGTVLYVCQRDPDGTLDPVIDTALGRPLQARIDEVGNDGESTAWLLGPMPHGLTIRRLELSRALPLTTPDADDDDRQIAAEID